MLSINTNLSSIIAQNSMKQSTNALNQTIERMSTGFKINHAKDNAANYSISTNMTTKIGSYQIAEENAAMGLDLVTTASSTLDLVSEHVQRIRDLCEQASNGTYGEESLKAIQSEVDARQQEIDRILSQAEYNGIKMLEENVTYSEETTNVPFLKEITRLTEQEAIEQGYTVVKTDAELINALQNNESICLMNDITITSNEQFLVDNVSNSIIQGNGFSLIWNSNGLPGSSPAIIENAADVKLVNLNISYQGYFGYGFSSIAYVSENLTLKNCVISGEVESQYDFSGVSMYNHGELNLIDTYLNYNSVDIASTRKAICYTNNGTINTSNFYYNGDVIGDISSDGYISTSGLNTLLASAYTKARVKTGIEQKNINLQIGTMGDSNSQISFVSSVALESLAINCLDFDSARNSLTTLDDYLKKINAKQVEYGAVQNRLESALEEISVQYDNLVSSRSTLRDADIAEESSKYIQAQILQQASATLMSTANQSPSIALQLI